MHCILSIDSRGISGLELSGMLSDLPVRVCSTSSVRDAERLINKEKIELIFWTADVYKDECFLEIKFFMDRIAGKPKPLYIICGLEGDKYIEKANECGAQGLFNQPCDPDEIRGKVAEIFNLVLPKNLKYKMNHAYVTYSLTEHLDRQLKAAGRGNYPVSILLIEISCKDSVKCADTLVSVLNSRIRVTDTVFRITDNMIVMILPFADKQGCDSVKCKIMEIVNCHSTLTCLNEDEIIMANVAFPEDGKTQDRLLTELELRLADKK